MCKVVTDIKCWSNLARMSVVGSVGLESKGPTTVMKSVSQMFIAGEKRLHV